jgi:hypothetical protein
MFDLFSAAQALSVTAHNHEKAIEFLLQVHPGRLLHVTAINPDRKGLGFECTMANDDRSRKSLQNWLDSTEASNNYWSVNETRLPKFKKLNKEDIKAVHYFPVDIDMRKLADRNNTSVEEELDHIWNVLCATWPEGVPPATGTLFSGGGFQLFWAIPAFVTDGDPEKIKQIEAYGRWLVQQFRRIGLKPDTVDSVFNVDRIMRVPHTSNNPDEGKRKDKGRERAIASVIEWHKERVYTLDQFQQAFEDGTCKEDEACTNAEVEKLMARIDVNNRVRLDTLENLQIPDRLKIIIAQGRHPDPAEQKQGDGSDSGWTYDVTCNLPRFGISPEVTYGLITDEAWGISAHVMKVKRRGGDWQRTALRQVRRGLLQALGDKDGLEKFEQHAQAEEKLKEMNAKHFALDSHGGKFWIAEEKWVNGHKRISVQDYKHFLVRYGNQFVQTGETKKGLPKMVMVGNWWLGHKERRTYHDLDTDPGEPKEYTDPCGNLMLNRWTGLGYVPKAGDWSLWDQHLRTDLFIGDEAYSYAMDWTARAVQFPGELLRSVLVIIGEHGCGKSLFLKWFAQMFGAHGLQCATPTQLTGQFQGQLIDALAVVIHEAKALRNEQNYSKFKTLVTEDVVAIEAKRKDSIQVKNRLKLAMASNEDDAVTTTLGDRRNAVFKASDAHTPRVIGADANEAYFGPIVEQMERQGGLEAWLHGLLQRDVSKFNPGKIPNTAARNAQKLATSLTPVQEELLDMLRTGFLFDPVNTVTENLRNQRMIGATEFRDYVQRRFPRDKITGNAVSDDLKALGFKQDRSIRPTAYDLPDIRTARAAFDEKFAPVEWPVELDENGKEIEPEWSGAHLGNASPHVRDELKAAEERHRSRDNVAYINKPPF